MKSYLKMTIVILIAYVITFLALTSLQSHSNYQKNPIGAEVTTTIRRTDGTTESHQGDNFPILNRGDALYATIPIPDSIPYDSPILCFGIYHCQLTVSWQGQVLYSYGQDLVQKGAQIGSVYVSLPIPEEALGSSIQLHAISNEKNGASDLIDVSILPSKDSSHWIIMENLPEAVFLITILTCSFMMTIVLILSDGRRKFIRVSLWLLSFMSMLATYRLASTGLLYALISNDRLCSNAEYVTFFAMPLPLLAFCGEFFNGKHLRIPAFIVLGIHAVFFTVITVLNYTTQDYHYCQFIRAQHILVGTAVIVALILSRKLAAKDSEHEVARCMVHGLYNFVICGTLDLARYYLLKFTMLHSPLFHIDFLFLGILLMSASFILSIFLKVTQVYAEKQKKNYFQHLAYTDILTDLGNRTNYYEQIASLRTRHVKDYTIFFLDLNNLKEVNDQFGHEYGDLYIKAAAAAIQQTFLGADATFRIGGDEFLVIYEGPQLQKISVLYDNLRENFESVCTGQAFPFRGSIACGVASSTLDTPIDPEVAVKQADSKMYEDKKQIKEKYGSHCKIVSPI